MGTEDVLSLGLGRHNIDLFYDLVTGLPNFPNNRAGIVYSVPSLPRPLCWTPESFDNKSESLISYFQNIVSKSLASVNDPVQGLCSLLLRMALGDSSLCSSAVLQAVLALSSLYLYGPAKAMPYKVKALSALTNSAKRSLGFKEGLQHIASGIILGLVEVGFPPLFKDYQLNIYNQINDASGWTSSWAVHICHAKKLVDVIYSNGQEYRGDSALILDWVYYHDVLSKFGISGSLGGSLEIFDAISQLCDMVLDPDDPTRHDEVFIQKLRSLELRFENIHQSVDETNGPLQFEQRKYAEQIAELYRLAGLIYLLRAGMKLPHSSMKCQTLIDKAFQILSQLDTCDRPFPLFIIACEARDDGRRSQILDLIRRSQDARFSGGLDCAQKSIEACWIQDDLHAGQVEIDCALKFTAVLSMHKFVPSLA
ncbi:hypothetical protein FQN51_009429 [Onygenales sp. PD_10]|nr:hypothetical protein FQN51_009429 [Onygenales sp. PD_10]